MFHSSSRTIIRFSIMLTPLLFVPQISWAQSAQLTPPSYARSATPAFEQMLAHIYQENPQLNAERNTLRTLDERVSQAAAGYRPTAAANAELGEARVSENSAAWRYGQDRNIGLIVTQPLYNGATTGQWHAADKRVLAGRARLLATEQKVFMTAITAWLDVYEKEEQLALTRDNTRLTQSYLEATRARLTAGDGTQTDIAVAESRMADGETRRAMAESSYASSVASYERATGMRGNIPELPFLSVDLPRSREETLSLARLNPELEQANQEVQAAEDDVDSASGARWPYIYLRGSMNDQHAADLGLQRLRSDSITINAAIPLYQGGLEYSREREAKIAHEKSRFDSLTISRNIIEEANQAWTRYESAQTVMQISNRAVDASGRAFAGIDEEQKRGTRTLTEVLDAQAQVLNTKITALQARKELQLESYRLLAAVGRLTAQGMNLPTKMYDPTTHYDDVSGRWFGTAVEPVSASYTPPK